MARRRFGEEHAVLLAFLAPLRDAFVEAGFDRLAEVELRIDPSIHDTPRHFAACREDGRLILAAPELCDQSAATAQGILAHELGHAADFLYPGEWLLRGRSVVFHPRAEQDEASYARVVRGWQRRSADDVELTADAIVATVLGHTVGYCGPLQLQQLGSDCPRRPRGLR